MFSDLVHYGALSCKLVLLSYWFSVTINNAYIAKYFFDLFHFFIGYTPVVANQLENSQLFGKILSIGLVFCHEMTNDLGPIVQK